MLREKPTGMIRTAYDLDNDPYLIEITGTEAKRFIDIIKADDEGRLLVLPCKVGDMVYTAQREVVSELRVEHVALYNVGIWVGWHLISGLYGNFRIDGFPASKIGKTVFLTREEAEKALEKGGKR